MIWVTLTPKQIEWATALGDRRMNDCRAKDRKHGNDQHTNNPGRTPARNKEQDRRGAIAEAVVYSWLGGRAGPCTWNYWSDDIGKEKDYADIEVGGVRIDAKGIVNNTYHKLIGQPGKVQQSWHYVLVGCEFSPRFALLGWALGRDILYLPLTEEGEKGRPAHFMRQDHSDFHKDMDVLYQRVMKNAELASNGWVRATA